MSNFSYNRDWEEIEIMLDFAERKQNKHYSEMQNCNKGERMYHMRNYKALEGVIKSLRWVLGDKNIEHPLE
ncbi:MAG: hypothetical protein GOVbin556_12 [Prokaryotic dsDNA virus sp.]|nr:MAG: hypothetical protein GOVbin556_12 [Prokaryotic dsDNA virus sp.]|tara:strand:+ start:200 stop:412 length:213 start_codon:yes stop_codon:yes gene_type:complete